MHLAHPVYFFLAFLIGGVILLYFFRKQYHQVINPSNLLWAEVMDEWQASPWLKKLQQNLLFWLQIAALALLMFALVKPFWQSPGLAGEHLIFIVDTSSTMSAENDEGQRFLLAKNEMLQMADQLDSQEVTIIRAGAQPEVLLNRESAKGEINKAIKSLKLTYEHENIDDAFKLAVSLLNGKTGNIHVFSDSVSKEEIKHLAGNKYAEVHNSGSPAPNLALLSFGAARSGKDIPAVAVIENQGKKEQEAEFLVTSEGNVLFEKKVKIEPGSQEIVDIPSLTEQRYYVAEITNKDGYEADNEAAIVLAPADPPVYALGNVNPFLMKGFKSLGIESTQIDQKSLASADEGGILLVEGEIPEKIPGLPMLIINKSGEKPYGLKGNTEVSDSPILEYTNFEKTYIQSAGNPFSSSLETIAENNGRPLIQSGLFNGLPVIAVNFAIEDSDWPLQPGFPIFLYNSYEWLSRQSGFLGYFQPGEEKWIKLDTKGGPLEVFDREGKSLDEFDLSKENFKAPSMPGIYQASAGNQIHYFSVLLDDREKNPRHMASFVLNESASGKEGKAVSENESAWLWLGIAALALLMLEWEVFRRGIGR